MCRPISSGSVISASVVLVYAVFGDSNQSIASTDFNLTKIKWDVTIVEAKIKQFSIWAYTFSRKYTSVIIPFVFFIAAMIIHFGKIIIDMSGSLYWGPGDHTNGLIWLYSVDNSTPWWRHSDISNYPNGESLWSPTFALGQILFITFWLLSKLFHSPVAGYNALGFLGFALSFALAYYYFYKKTHKPMVASIVAYFIAFSSMILGLFGVGHIAYLFSGFYIFLTLILVELLLNTRKARYIISLGLVLGSTLYFDPYFVLIVSVVFACAVLSFIIFHFIFKKPLLRKESVVRLTLAVLVGLIIATPGLYYTFFKNDINQTVVKADKRSSSKFEATIYSSKAADYLLPSYDNKLYPDSFRTLKQASFHGKNATFTTFIGYSFLLFIVLSFGIAASIFYRKRKKLSNTEITLITVGLVLLLVGLVFSLRPELHLFGKVRIITPADIHTSLTVAWRVIARLNTVVLPGILMSATALFLYVSRNLGKPRKNIYIAYACLTCVVLAIELMPTFPISNFTPWTYENGISKTYQRIKQDDGIKAIAEYPIREEPFYQGSNYSAGQFVHGKPTLNPRMNQVGLKNIRNNIQDLFNPQTLPILRGLGIDTLNVYWSEKTGIIPRDFGAENIMNDDFYSQLFGRYTVSLYKIPENIQPGRYYVDIVGDERISYVSEYKVDNIYYPMSGKQKIQVKDICSLIDKTSHPVCASENEQSQMKVSVEVKNKYKEPVAITYSVNGGETKTVELQPGLNKITFDALLNNEDVITISIPQNRSLSFGKQHVVSE